MGKSQNFAHMLELADKLGLEPSAERRGGSTPSMGIMPQVEENQLVYLIPDEGFPDPENGQIWLWEDTNPTEMTYYLVLDVSKFQVPHDNCIIVELQRESMSEFTTIYDEVRFYPKLNFKDTKWTYLGRATGNWCPNCEERPADPDDYLCHKCRYGF